MEDFQLLIQPPALDDIQEAIGYYDSKRLGLGVEFEDELNKHFYSILNVKFFQIRYEEVRCLPLKIFPYMIHYSVDESNRQIIIRAVFNTHRDPKIWKRK
jgi:hypothetical protein